MFCLYREVNESSFLVYILFLSVSPTYTCSLCCQTVLVFLFILLPLSPVLTTPHSVSVCPHTVIDIATQLAKIYKYYISGGSIAHPVSLKIRHRLSGDQPPSLIELQKPPKAVGRRLFFQLHFGTKHDDVVVSVGVCVCMRGRQCVLCVWCVCCFCGRGLPLGVAIGANLHQTISGLSQMNVFWTICALCVLTMPCCSPFFGLCYHRFPLSNQRFSLATSRIFSLLTIRILLIILDLVYTVCVVCAHIVPRCSAPLLIFHYSYSVVHILPRRSQFHRVFFWFSSTTCRVLLPHNLLIAAVSVSDTYHLCRACLSSSSHMWTDPSSTWTQRHRRQTMRTTTHLSPYHAWCTGTASCCLYQRSSSKSKPAHSRSSHWVCGMCLCLVVVSLAKRLQLSARLSSILLSHYSFSVSSFFTSRCHTAHAMFSVPPYMVVFFLRFPPPSTLPMLKLTRKLVSKRGVSPSLFQHVQCSLFFNGSWPVDIIKTNLTMDRELVAGGRCKWLVAEDLTRSRGRGRPPASERL